MKSSKLFNIDLIARSLSQLGDTIFYPVMLSIAATMDNPSLAMLLVSLSEGIPVLLSVLIGALADKTRQRYRVMQCINVLRFVLYTVSAIVFMQDVSVAFYLTLVINFLSDCFGKGYNPLSNALLVSYSTEEEVTARQGKLGAASALLQVVGPLIGSALVLVIGVAALVQLNALSFLATAAVLLLGRVGFTKLDQKINMEHDAVHTESPNLLATIKVGSKYLTNDPILFRLISFAFIINFLFSPITKIILPLSIASGTIVAIQSLAMTMGIFMAAISTGMIIGSLVADKFSKYPPLKLFSGIILIFAGMIAAMGGTASPYVLAIIFICIGFIMGIVNTIFMAAIMKKTPPAHIGVVTSLTMLIAAGGMVFGDTLASLLLLITSGQMLLLLIGGILAIAVLVFVYSNRRLLHVVI